MNPRDLFPRGLLPPDNLRDLFGSGTKRKNLDAVVELLSEGLHLFAEAGGMDRQEAEQAVQKTVAYLQRRLDGDVVIDDFGFDADFTDHVYLPVLRPLFRSWFRTEVHGAENIPATGGAMVVANHAGTIAIDALMTQVAVHDAHPAGRYLRLLGADIIFRTPFLGEFTRRGGATMASRLDARRLLAAGEVVGVWPEGYKGVGKPFSERYQLQRFGRGGFISSAASAGVPIVPCAIVGSEEVYPKIGEIEPLAKLFDLPYFPVTPFFPHFGLLGTVPLPSKWMFRFGEPIDVAAELGVEPGSPAALSPDPVDMFRLTEEVRGTVQQMVYDLVEERGSTFAP